MARFTTKLGGLDFFCPWAICRLLSPRNIVSPAPWENVGCAPGFLVTAALNPAWPLVKALKEIVYCPVWPGRPEAGPEVVPFSATFCAPGQPEQPPEPSRNVPPDCPGEEVA